MVKKEIKTLKFLETMKKKEGIQEELIIESKSKLKKRRIIANIKATSIILTGLSFLIFGPYHVGLFMVHIGISKTDDTSIFNMSALGILTLGITVLSLFALILIGAGLQDFYKSLVNRFDNYGE
jgi:hypothetical protein